MDILHKTTGELLHRIDKDSYQGAILAYNKLQCANLRGFNLANANLWEADLREADLRDANLCKAALYKTNLEDADLSGAYLAGADLRRANLEGANLAGANLAGADLRGANLQLADLNQANLTGSNLQGADLQNTILPTEVISLDGLRWPVTILLGYMRIGCQHYHVRDWEQFTDAEIALMDSCALEFWQANKQKLIAIANFTEVWVTGVTND